MTVAQTLVVTGTVQSAGTMIAAAGITPASSGANFGLADRTTGTITMGKGPVTLSFSGSQTNVRGTLQVDQAATFSSTVQATEYRVGGVKVLGAQGGPISNSVNGWGVDGRNLFNALLAELRNHGIIG